MSTIIDSIEQRQRQRVPRFDAGDRVRVHFQVIEGSRKRTQVFEGVVMKRQGNGLRETFTVRKQSFGVGVERTFPLHSPKIEKLEVAARGDVRRAKLYYLRDRVGKAARVAERRWGIEEDVLGAEEEHAVDAEGISQEDLAEEAEAADVEAELDEDEGGSAAGPVAADDSPDSPEDGEPGEPTATPPAEGEASADEQDPAETSTEDAEQDGGEDEAAEAEPSQEGGDEAEEPAETGEEATG